MKISILLPYKENFSPKYAGAVSLFVNDTVKNSKFSKNTYIFGSMSYPKPFLKKYINLPIKKKIFQSTSKNYVLKFLKKEKIINSDIIEIHNRPNYIKYLYNNQKKIILYFHNDPLSMLGSKSIKDRINLLNRIDKIIFNSKWSQNRFFIGILNEKLLKQKTAICYQSSSRAKINFTKKEKIISFIGKLNSAKGYDLFGKAIIKILNEYNDWKAIVYGDEPREKLDFYHKNLKVNGYTHHNKILKFLEKVSISVICSRWEEPFGRTSLEAASRGCATIISNKGGLPETTDSGIILNKLTSNEIYKEIKQLILNKQKLKRNQINNFKNFKFDHPYITRLIDTIRSEFINIKNIYFLRKKLLKIMHITNFNERFNGRLHYNTGRRINNGFIRNYHTVFTLSDRDYIHYSKNILDLKGSSNFNNKIFEINKIFKPDIIILGHADIVSSSTIDEIKNLNKNIKIAQWFLD